MKRLAIRNGINPALRAEGATDLFRSIIPTWNELISATFPPGPLKSMAAGLRMLLSYTRETNWTSGVAFRRAFNSYEKSHLLLAILLAYYPLLNWSSTLSSLPISLPILSAYISRYTPSTLINSSLRIINITLGFIPIYRNGLISERSSTWTIKKYGRWTSDAALLYQRDELDIWRRVQEGFQQL